MTSTSGLAHIMHLVEAKKVIDLAKGHLKASAVRLEKAYDDRDRLADLLNEKYESIEKLENNSLRYIFSAILKNREQQLEMERQEYLQVVLQYNESKKQVELL